ncbi:hypothetical protein H696_04130 [Fonticula alba]|uniref:Uncharacterized protein n=1 Tax=Fonticula alba TaxID=691883 RepID=A0A058Z604_FONAL|nr:hypothetical protein H696_04130 [Fonticula alba]KCV69724.1 hypothetical protein H696_04130 [Fonticula alba]|eukprot:XP_009496289.1 hypothetical protein H696_04130 [Fonticula alba]
MSSRGRSSNGSGAPPTNNPRLNAVLSNLSKFNNARSISKEMLQEVERFATADYAGQQLKRYRKTQILKAGGKVGKVHNVPMNVGLGHRQAQYGRELKQHQASLEAGNLTSKHAPTLKRGRESSLAGEMRRQGGDIGSRTRFGKFVDGIFHISEHTRVKHEREIRPPSADKLRGGKSAGKASKKASGGKKKKKFRR